MGVTDYILGRKFTIESDHKPLIPLLNSRDLDALPPRIVRFRLRLAKYDYTVTHVPGKVMYTADKLSRAPLASTGTVDDVSLEEEVQGFVEGVLQSLPATKGRLEEYSTAQQKDPVCAQMREYCESEWPVKEDISPELAPYFKVQNQLTLCENLLLYNGRIVIPSSLRKETLEKVHSGHQGVERCRARGSASVWWPGVMAEVQQMVQGCVECAEHARSKREPLIPTLLPAYPWQVVGTDLFELNREQYLLVVDYFSRYSEFVKLASTTSTNVIAVLKAMFARHGVPETVRSDNGPQFASMEFTQFAREYGFRHVTSSPRATAKWKGLSSRSSG